MEKNFQKMKIKIGKGHHYPWLIPIAFPVWVSKKNGKLRMANFMFTESCLFDLHDEDQWDVNKLFGFSIGHHQKKSSFRFGWRPKLETGKIEIVAYEYHDNVRQKTMPICEVEINKWYKYCISYRPYSNRSYYFVGDDGFHNDINLKKKWGLGYTLGVYFGGNEKAPQDVIIYKKPA
jgi:hypothetical protein